jgi:signal transduction histidine kinase
MLLAAGANASAAVILAWLHEPDAVQPLLSAVGCTKPAPRALRLTRFIRRGKKRGTISNMSSAAAVQTAVVALPEPAVLRTIAHELRQPLSAIETIAYYLSLVLPQDDDRSRGHAEHLQRLVEQSNWILNCALELSNDAPLAPQPVDLEELITQVLAARQACTDSAPRLELAGDLPPVRLDPARGKALVTNLFLLFEQISVPAHPVHVRTFHGAEGSGLEIFCRAPGCRAESFLGPGSSLSVMSARRVVEAHGGKFSIAMTPDEGTRVRVVLP